MSLVPSLLLTRALPCCTWQEEGELVVIPPHWWHQVGHVHLLQWPMQSTSIVFRCHHPQRGTRRDTIYLGSYVLSWRCYF